MSQKPLGDGSAQNKSTDELLAVLAHDIRNPLAAVVNGIQILRQSGTTGPLAEQTLDLIERQLKLVIQLVGDMLQPDPGPQETRSDTAAEAMSALSASAGPLKILVVEDDRDVAKSFASMLRLWGHEVFVAYDGLQALNAADRNCPEIVLLDLELPGLDGYAVAQRLRTSAKSTHIHLIAVTASGDETHRRLSREAGFDHHLVKPVAPSVLKHLFTSLGAKNHTITPGS